MDGSTAARPAPPPGFDYLHDDDSAPAAAATPSAPAAAPTLTRAAPAPMAAASAAPAGASMLTRPAAPAGFSYDTPEPETTKAAPKDDGYGILDVPKALVGGVVHGIGATVRGLGEASDTLNPTGIISRKVMSDDTPQWIQRPGTTIGDFIGSPIEKVGDWIKGTESDKAKAAQQAPLVQGKLLDPKSWSFGEGASSPMNWTLKGTDLVGNLAPMILGSEATGARALARAPGMTAEILAAVRAGKVAELAPEAQQVAQAALTRSGRASVAAGAATGGVQGAEDAAQGESQRVQQMSDADLQKLPAYSSMIARGMKPEDARTALADQVRARVFATTLPVATAAGAITTAPLLHEAQGTLAKVVGESALRRAGAGAALEAPVQGAIAVGQTAAQTAAANSATGETRDPLEDSLATFGAGALPGAVFGGLGGLHRPAPGSLSEAATLVRDPAVRLALPAPVFPVDSDGRVANTADMERARQVAQARADYGLTPDVQRAQAARNGEAPPVAAAGIPDPNSAQPPAAAPAPAVQAGRQAQAADAATADRRPVDPITPSWVNPDTGEVGVPTKDDLVGAIAQQMRAQYDASGILRINSGALADAWGVSANDVKRARRPAELSALDAIAKRERSPAPAPEADAAPVQDDIAAGAGRDQAAPTDASLDAEMDARARASQEAGDEPARTFDDVERNMNAGLDASRDRLNAALGGEPAAASAEETPVVGDDKSAHSVDESPKPVDGTADAVDAGAAPPAEAGGSEQPVAPDGGSPIDAANAGVDGENSPETGTEPAQSGTKPVESGTKGPDRVPETSSRAAATPIEQADTAGTRAVLPEPTPAAKRADSLRVKTADGEMNAKRFVDGRVAAGFDQVESQRMGDKLQHRLVNAEGEKVPLPAGILPYAQEAIASARVAAKDATARNERNATAPEPAKAPTAEAVAAHAEAAPVHPVDVAAAEAATSPHNDRPEPTQAQKEAGNYKMGHVQIHGLDVSIENPRGSVRSGVDAGGKPWSHAMSDHYGYVRGTVGADGDHVDVYVGPKPEARRVFVVDQIHQDTGKFDEHKAMMGFASKRDALTAYRSNFDKGWKVGPVRDFTMDQFKDWLKSGDTKSPAIDAPVTPATAPAANPAAPAAKAAVAAPRRGGLATNGARVRVAGGKLEYVPHARETLEAYFKPGEVRPGYAGKQKIDAFNWNDGRWNVTVHSVRDDGSDLPARQGEQRTHSTAPTSRDLRAVLGKPELPAKGAPAGRASANAPVHDFSFAGESARTADLEALDRARDREREGFGTDPDRFGHRVGSVEDTHTETGWHRGADGKWRFEIDDSKATVKPEAVDAATHFRSAIEHSDRALAARAAGDEEGNTAATEASRASSAAAAKATVATVGDVLDHPDLFKAYPELASVPLKINGEMGHWGSYDSNRNQVTMRPPADYPRTGNRSFKSVLLHEIQHAVQEKEGFARGGSSAEFAEPLQRQRKALLLRKQTIEQMQKNAREADDAARVRSLEVERQRVNDELSGSRLQSEESVRSVATEQYRRLAGEVEARDTQRRVDMTAEDRRSTPPTETQDVPRSEQIVRFRDGAGSRSEGDAATPTQNEHAERMTEVAREATKAWHGDDIPHVEVVATPEQLPYSAKVDPNTGKPDPSYKRASGFHDGKTIWLVASAHRDDAAGHARLSRTLAHEAVGHFGVDRVVNRELGADAWKKIEASVLRLEKDGAGGKQMQGILGEVRRRYGDVDNTTFARETIAVMAERGVRNGLLDRAVSAVQAFLRRIMPDLKLLPAELRQLLVRSSEYLERGESYEERVERQSTMSFSRDGWPEGFPDVVLGHKLGTVREHPDYAAAKAGDDSAALRLARDTVTKDFADRVKAAIPEGSEPTIVPVVAMEATGNNRIPIMTAEVLAKRLGLEVDHGMIQAEKVGRGAGDAMHRLANQPTFEGKVTAGKDYVLLDDTLTQGGTLAQLKTHIEREGGHVVLATSLTGKDYSRKLALDPTTLGNVRDRFGRIEGWWRRQFGHGFDGLTESEARTILTYDRGRLSPDALRDRVIAHRIPGLGEVGEGAVGDRSGAQAPGAGGRDEAGPVKEAPPKPRSDFSLDDRGEREEPGTTRKPFSKASASIESMNEVMPKLDDGAFQRAKEWAKGKLLDAEPHLLGALQLRHVLELASDTKVLKRHADFYADTFQRMDADRNTMTMEGSAKADRLNKWSFEHGPAGWAGKLTEEAKGLFKFMHEVTQVTVDPTSDYERLLMRDDRGEQTPWTEDLRKQRIKTLQEQMRGRAGDDKTALLDQIKDLRKLPAREKVRELKYPEQVAKWNALSPEAKEMFTMMRDHYRETSERLEEATLARIQALDIPEQNKRAAAEMVRTNFADNKVGGVYFPLARFGDYWIASRLPGEDGEGGEYHFTKYEDAYAAQRAEKKLLAAGHTIEATGRQNKDYETQKPVTGTFMGQLTGMLRQGGAPDKVLDDIHQMFLRTLPELSLRKSGIHRSNVAGYTDNVPRIFASNVLHGAHQIARARYGYQLEDSMEHMRATVEGNRPLMGVGQAAHADALVGELAKRHQWIMNPTNSKLATMINSVGFTYYLSASPASALVNLSQGAMVTLPVLGARHGWPAAMREMGFATRDAMRTFGNIRKVLATDDERRAFDTLEANGTFARTATHSLGGIAEGDALKMNPAYAKVMTAMGYMFQKAEVINRESAGIAAFRLATKDGKSFNEAIKYADEIVNGTHFDYSNANRARFMQGNAQKVLFQFKNYALGMSWVLYRNLEQSLRGETPEVRRVARRTLTGVLGMTTLFAGIMGTPINNLLSAGANAYHAATGDDDTPWDFNTEFRAWLSDHLGARAASVIADGVVDQLGANISGRVGTSDLWFREPDKQLVGGPAYDQFLESMAGPIGGLTKNLFVGSNMVSQGHTERGVETMMPTFIKNAMKSVRFAKEGVNNLRGDPIVSDVSGPEKLIQAIGFQPTKIAEQQRVNSAMMNYQQGVQDRRQSLMNAFAMATNSGDSGSRSEALAKIRTFNKKYPEISIGMGNLQASLRRRAHQSAQAENGIQLNRKLAPRIRAEVGGFAAN
jgi:hypothetical protein